MILFTCSIQPSGWLGSDSKFCFIFCGQWFQCHLKAFDASGLYPSRISQGKPWPHTHERISFSSFPSRTLPILWPKDGVSLAVLAAHIAPQKQSREREKEK